MSQYMSPLVSIIIVFCGLLVAYSILRAIMRKQMPETHGILWLIAALFIIIGGCFPSLFVDLAHLLGVDYPPTLVFTLAIILLFYLVFRCTMWIANMTIRLQELGMQVSLLNQENIMLLKKIKALGGKDDDA